MMGTSRSVSPLPSAWALLYHGQLARRRALELLKKVAAESDSDTDSLAEERAADAAADAKDGMSDSSGCFPVDTDVDVCVEEFLTRPVLDADVAHTRSDSDGAAAPSAEVAPSAGWTRLEGRRPPGTWTI